MTQLPPAPAPQPYGAPVSPVPPPKKYTERTIAIVIVASVAAFVLLVAGIAAWSVGRPRSSQDPGNAIETTSGPTLCPKDGSWDNGSTTESPEATSTATTYTPHKSDWSLKVKVTEKKCFGYGYGCNVTFKVKPSYYGLDDLPNQGIVELTYKVKGAKDGAVTGTFEIECPTGKYSDWSEELVQTSSSGTKLTAKVTDIEYNEWG